MNTILGSMSFECTSITNASVFLTCSSKLTYLTFFTVIKKESGPIDTTCSRKKMQAVFTVYHVKMTKNIIGHQ